MIRNFHPDAQISKEEIGKVVRVDSYEGGRKGITRQVLPVRRHHAPIGIPVTERKIVAWLRELPVSCI